MSNVATLPLAASGFEPLTADEVRKMDAYWRACNYLSAGMLYLCTNPLLREPLKPEHIKNRLLGHWGSDPGTELYLGSPEPANQEVRPRHHLPLRAGPWSSRDALQQLPRRGVLGGLSREQPGRARACRSSSSSSRFLAESAVTVPRKLRVRFTRAGNWGTAFPMDSAQPSTIPTLS